MPLFIDVEEEEGLGYIGYLLDPKTRKIVYQSQPYQTAEEAFADAHNKRTA